MKDNCLKETDFYCERETLGAGRVKVAKERIKSNSGVFGLTEEGHIVLLTSIPHYLTRKDLKKIQKFLRQIDAEKAQNLKHDE